ncbi:MAG TPA: YncE family protein [Bryobacteraceae bacterium]|jgi:DNA-binding beta-propeller fold protein YncE|nr:YncE family protein [Bryobacteraceae bacterium]
MRAARLVLSLAFLTLSIAWCESTPRTALLVLSKGDHTLAIVDPSNLKVVGKAPVGADPHEVIASSDGKIAYVSIYGGGAYNTLNVIDLINQKALPSINLGPLRGPHGLTFVGGKTWFTAEGAKAIASYDPASHAVDWILGTGQNRTHMIIVSEDMKQIFTTNVSSGTVSIIEKTMQTGFGPPPPGGPGAGGPPPPPRRGSWGPPGGDWNETVVPVGRGAEGFDISPDAKELWAANAQDGTVSIIDIATKKVMDTLQANVAGANRLKFTPDGKHVLITSLGNAGLVILDASTHQEMKRIDLHGGAAGIQMQPDGSRAFVACTGGNYVAVVDLKTMEITGRIDAGPQPDGLAWSVMP